MTFVFDRHVLTPEESIWNTWCTLGSVLDPGTPVRNTTDTVPAPRALHYCGGRQACNTQTMTPTRVGTAKRKLQPSECRTWK